MSSALGLLLAAWATAALAGPSARFDPPEVNFGVQAPGAVLDAEVKLINTGDVPLTVLRSGTSCGCTNAEDLSGRTIPVGGFIEVKVTMTLKSGLGEKEERLFAMFREMGRDYISVPFRATVSLPVQLTPPHLDVTEATSGIVTVESRDGRPFRVLSAGGAAPTAPPGEKAAFDDPLKKHRLYWDAGPWIASGEVPWFWVVETDHPEAQLMDARVRHEATKPKNDRSRPWQPKDQRLVLGTLRNGQPTIAKTTLEYASAAPQPDTATARSVGGHLKARIVNASVEDKELVLQLELTPHEAPAGLLMQTIRIGASGAETELHIIARIEPGEGS